MNRDRRRQMQPDAPQHTHAGADETQPVHNGLEPHGLPLAQSEAMLSRILQRIGQQPPLLAAAPPENGG